MPMSGKFVPELDLWKIGWFGRPGARDILGPETDRAWFVVYGACWRLEMELELSLIHI